MAHARLILATLFAVACGPAQAVQAPTDNTPPPPPPQPSGDPLRGSWGRFHSVRFHFTLPLPDGKSWTIDDHTQPWLHATHPATGSDVTAMVEYEHELVNHAACEEKARAKGFVPAGDLRTVESQITVGPEAFDSRVWVALEQKGKDGPLVGHVFLFGAFVRKCLLVHLATPVARVSDEPVLSERLAAARLTMIGDFKLDPPRTTEDADVPRESPKQP